MKQEETRESENEEKKRERVMSTPIRPRPTEERRVANPLTHTRENLSEGDSLRETPNYKHSFKTRERSLRRREEERARDVHAHKTMTQRRG